MKKQNIAIITLVVLLVGVMQGVFAFDTYINNSNIFVDGSVGIGTTSPLGKLHLTGNNTILAIGNATTSYGGFRYNDNKSKLQFSHDNGTTWDNVGSGSGNTSGGSFYGSLEWQATTSCVWGSTATSFADFSADTDCDDNARTARGLTTSDTSVGHADGRQPMIKFDSMPAGYYKITALSEFDSDASQYSAWRFSDGTHTTAAQTLGFVNGEWNVVTGTMFIPTDQGATTISLQADTNTGTVNIFASGGDTGTEAFYIEVYYFPSFGSSKNDTVFSDLDGDTRINVDGDGNDSDNIAIFTNGTQKVIIDSSGNVGIGTTSPSSKLGIEFGGGGAGKALAFREGEDNFYILANFTGTGETGNWIELRDWQNDNIMTWRADNRIGIGTTDPDEALHIADGSLYVSGNDTKDLRYGVSLAGDGTGPDWANIELRGDTGGYIDFSNDLTSDFDARIILNADDTLAVDGADLQNPGRAMCDNDGALGTCTSDARLKENIKPIENAVLYLMDFKPVEFNFIGDDELTRGLIAQDVEKVHPELIRPSAEPGYITYEDPGFKYILVKAVQELKAENDKLRLENDALKKTFCDMGRREWC